MSPAVKKTSRRKKSSFSKFSGILLATFSGVLLFACLSFLAWKWWQPTPLAKIFPAEETLFFAEFRGDGEGRFEKLFTAVPVVDLLDLSSLGFSDPELIFRQLGGRVGVGYLGDEFDPGRFVFVARVRDVDGARLALAAQAATGEELAVHRFFGTKIYSYPQSLELAFAFRGRDLLLTDSVSTLERLILGGEKISETGGYAAVIDNLDFRSPGFAYASPRFLEQVLIGRLTGLDRAVAEPIADSFVGAGAALTPEADGLELTTHLALQTEFARQPFFADVADFDPTAFRIFGAETEQFFAATDFAAQLSAFSDSLTEAEPSWGMLTAGGLNSALEKWLGQSDFDFASLLTGETIFARTTAGTAFVFAASPGRADEISNLLENADGLLSARTRIVHLPDGSMGAESVPAEVDSREFEIAGTAVTRFDFAREASLFLAEKAGYIFLAPDREILENWLTRLADAEGYSLDLAFSRAGIAGENLIYSRVTAAERLPQLFPFDYSLSSVSARADGLFIHTFLAK